MPAPQERGTLVLPTTRIRRIMNHWLGFGLRKNKRIYGFMDLTDNSMATGFAHNEVAGCLPQG